MNLFKFLNRWFLFSFFILVFVLLSSLEKKISIESIIDQNSNF